ncbi:restriction endonuclease subunit S [Candidatus Woesearchaeota archaeon]|nr:restriction endonuclease subunit S [Candidatus Woesearchaeota archaeon]
MTKSECIQTEIGVIPKDWDLDSIKNHASITTGAKNTQDKIDDGKYPFFVRSQKVEKINSYSFDGEAVLTAGDGVGTGKIFHYIKGKFDFHQRVYKISHFDEKLDGYFFYLYFSNNFYNRIMSMTAKSSVDSVRMEMIADMKIPLPDITEQIAIGTSTKDIQELIESLNKLIDKKKKLKQGAMQQLLTGKKRLPGFENEWTTKYFDEVFSISAGGDLDKDDFSKEQNEICQYPIYSNSLSNKGLYGYSSSYQYASNHITITARGTIGWANSRYHKFSAIGRILILKPIINVDCFFLAEYINNNLVFSIESTGVPQLTAPQISKYKLIFPSDPKEQSAIAEVLTDMDLEIEELEKKRDKYLKIKIGMMQQLLTGRIRLK